MPPCAAPRYDERACLQETAKSAATELMVKYAAYHRDRRNLATHFVGVPMLVFAVGALLARPSIEVAGWPITPAAIAWGLSTLWYLTRGDLALGLAVSLANLVLILAALPLAQLDTPTWLAWSLGTFIVGWAIQFVGYYYEGKKPAFADDLRGLLVRADVRCRRSDVLARLGQATTGRN